MRFSKNAFVWGGFQGDFMCFFTMGVYITKKLSFFEKKVLTKSFLHDIIYKRSK